MARFAVALLGLTLTCSVLTGCNGGMKEENASLMQENAELREQKAQLEAALGNEQSAKAGLAAEVESLRQQLGAGGVARGPGGTGLEGEGWTVDSRGTDIVVGIAGDVLFDSGKATLKASAKKSLDQIASSLRSRYGGRVIRVEGYTDTDPIRKSGWKDNEELSAQRALAVERYLVSKGLSGSQVYAAAFGPANPKGNKSQSRRVEIVILDAAG
ncbi:MAG TPA: OmpA family protein [Phycisphaerales bacterium]|nr:OmpA family protein [Phycisphaerales bacterium]